MPTPESFQGTPTKTGLFTGSVSMADITGKVSISISFFVESASYAGWRSAYWTLGNPDSGAEHDPDGDGLRNLTGRSSVLLFSTASSGKQMTLE